MTITERRKRAENILSYYRYLIASDFDNDCDLSDLMADLLHLTYAPGTNPDEAVETGKAFVERVGRAFEGDFEETTP